MASMAESTKIRPFSRLLDQADSPLWVINPDGKLVFLSAAAGTWLQLEPESLIGRHCIAGTSLSDDPLDYLAASLSPPPGLAKAGVASLLVQPTFPGDRTRRVKPMQTRYIRVGHSADAFTLAVAGSFAETPSDPAVEAAVTLREQLDSWRRHHGAVASYLTVGDSRIARRIANQVRVAESCRGDLLIVSPPGCFADSVAESVHTRAAPGEPIVWIEGTLMDAELLDASLGAVMPHLTDSENHHATAVVRDIDQTPADAQLRLGEHLRQFGWRLRLIAVSSEAASVRNLKADSDEQALALEPGAALGIDNSVADRLCAMRVVLEPLASRVTDIPLIATAMLDRRKAAGETRADRFARATLDALVIYPWPDNFRELDQAIRQAARACTREVITPENLPLAIRSYRPNTSVPVEQQHIDLDQSVAAYEMDLILRTLDAAEGNRAEAARRLNISRARLLRKLDTHREETQP